MGIEVFKYDCCPYSDLFLLAVYVEQIQKDSHIESYFLFLNWRLCAQNRWYLPFMTPDHFPVNMGVRGFLLDLTQIDTPDFDILIWHRFCKIMLTLHGHLIRLLFCKEVSGFQAFVPFAFVLFFSLFQICLVSLDYALLISHTGILHWT